MKQMKRMTGNNYTSKQIGILQQGAKHGEIEFTGPDPDTVGIKPFFIPKGI